MDGRWDILKMKKIYRSEAKVWFYQLDTEFVLHTKSLTELNFQIHWVKMVWEEEWRVFFVIKAFTNQTPLKKKQKTQFKQIKGRCRMHTVEDRILIVAPITKLRPPI